ncbi:hypothetical protein KSB_52680 [Ktedonobacter robiniae]|uniref:Uncharacterized protein n=1 Tax=Ktedonobacter robiniae TaxID=2778365 RepID=A0ABQ3UVU2_9CHLR|nr:hypothetical protein KSB_52680 [Ktedonobacter robiniae]
MSYMSNPITPLYMRYKTIDARFIARKAIYRIYTEERDFFATLGSLVGSIFKPKNSMQNYIIFI